jgi:hypothetical protein
LLFGLGQGCDHLEQGRAGHLEDQVAADGVGVLEASTWAARTCVPLVAVPRGAAVRIQLRRSAILTARR